MFCIPYLTITFQLFKSDNRLNVYFLIVQDNYPFLNYLHFPLNNPLNAEGAGTWGINTWKASTWRANTWGASIWREPWISYCAAQFHFFSPCNFFALLGLYMQWISLFRGMLILSRILPAIKYIIKLTSLEHPMRG